MVELLLHFLSSVLKFAILHIKCCQVCNTSHQKWSNYCYRLYFSSSVVKFSMILIKFFQVCYTSHQVVSSLLNTSYQEWSSVHRTQNRSSNSRNGWHANVIHQHVKHIIFSVGATARKCVHFFLLKLLRVVQDFTAREELAEPER